MIEKAFPASQLWNSSPKNHPTRYNIYTGGLIYQKTSATSNSTSYCTPSLGGRGSRLTICQLNQFNTNSEAAMLSIESLRIHGWLKVHYVCETTHLNMKKLSSWYAFMRFQEIWYSYMGFLVILDGAVHLGLYMCCNREQSNKCFDKIFLLRFWNLLQY